jgi:hypothetical protein
LYMINLMNLFASWVFLTLTWVLFPCRDSPNRASVHVKQAANWRISTRIDSLT